MTVQGALWHIPANDRDTWVRMAMAIKSELGDGGFELWDTWSQRDDSYRSKDARAVWRSIHRGGGITVDSLYSEAKRSGWTNDADEVEAVNPRGRKGEDEKLSKRRATARLKAERMIRQAETSWHPYLVAKGFPEAQGLVLGELLLVPMRDFQRKLHSVQTITADGKKKFLAGGRAKGSVFARSSYVD